MKYTDSILRIAVVCFLIIAGIALTSTADTRNVNFRDIRSLGMGGVGVTTMDGFNSLIYNPALLGKSEFELELINIQAYASKDVSNLINFINDNQDLIDGFTDSSLEAQNRLIDGMTEFDNNEMGAGVYPKIGLSFLNFAIGAYGTSDVSFKLDMGIFEPRVFANGNIDVVYSAGAGFKLKPALISFMPNDLYAGAAVKIIRRKSIDFRASAADADFGSLIDSLESDHVTGYGIDLGMFYDIIPGKVAVGAKVTDFLSDIDGNKPPMLINVGASWKYSKNLLLAADYDDFFMARGDHFLNRLFLGGEYRFGRFVALRAGFGQGYPSFGAGLDFGAIAFDAAIYGIERGTAPGGDGDYNYSARLKIGM